jgi:signal peptidase I
MNANFLTLLFCATVFTGVISLIDKYLWQPKRRVAGIQKQPKIAEYCRSFFGVLFIVLIIRSFIGQLFVVPTGSLEPTIMPKAFILVDQFSYGIRLPLFETKIIPIGEPKVGDITLFHSPVRPNMDLIKRVIGVPGDKISYINKVLYVNGKEATQKFVGYTTDSGEDGSTWTVKIMQENLNGVVHNIYVCPKSSTNCPLSQNKGDFKNLIVPQGEYFMMGDNRDNSDDGRFWGFVPEKDIMGKGWRVLFSWNTTANKIRWDQVWKKL